MQIIDTQVSGLCSSCLMGNGGQCYCQSLDASIAGVSIRIISAPLEHLIQGNLLQTSEDSQTSLEVTQSQQADAQTQDTTEEISQYFQENGSTDASSPIPEVAAIQPQVQNVNRKVTKDNVSHKKISKFIEKNYRDITGAKISLDIKEFYYREDYACKIWTKLQKEGKLAATYPLFQTSMAKYKEKILKQLAQDTEKAGHLNHLLELIDRYMLAFEYFMSDELLLSLKTVYDFENMRQKKNFAKAWKELHDMRQKLGLPTEIQE